MSLQGLKCLQLQVIHMPNRDLLGRPVLNTFTSATLELTKLLPLRPVKTCDVKQQPCLKRAAGHSERHHAPLEAKEDFLLFGKTRLPLEATSGRSWQNPGHPSGGYGGRACDSGRGKA